MTKKYADVATVELLIERVGKLERAIARIVTPRRALERMLRMKGNDDGRKRTPKGRK